MASTSAPEKQEWLVILPDQEGALERRLSVRPKHFENLKAGVDAGFWKMGVRIRDIERMKYHHEFVARQSSRRSIALLDTISSTMAPCAILNDVPKEGEGLKFAGSALVAYGSSKEEVIEMLKKDVYAENDVWDFNKIQIWPFKTGLWKGA
ncbi:Dimeric alpha-beta barrel protein [Rutstroemia sp. NJR-2017a BBW]|nr:Dimeric alpha-beta barrel protein [Rutstroemia sp. NJR-2017a BBW]